MTRPDIISGVPRISAEAIEMFVERAEKWLDDIGDTAHAEAEGLLIDALTNLRQLLAERREDVWRAALEDPSARTQDVLDDDLIFEAGCEVAHPDRRGGQHVARACTAVRATHRPTGVAVAVAEHRSQRANKHAAAERLRQVLVWLASPLVIKGDVGPEAIARLEAARASTPVRMVRDTGQ